MFVLEERCAPWFETQVDAFDLGHLEAHPHAVYGLRDDFTLAYLNPAWFHFARDNGAPPDFWRRWGLGASVLETSPGPLRSFFEEAYSTCLSSARPWSHTYECSTPAKSCRFHMQVYRIPAGAGLLVLNSRVVERPHDPPDDAGRPIEEHYRDGDGILLQCSHCRRFQHKGDNGWDWIPAWVETRPANTSGGLCLPCFRTHFPCAQWPLSSSEACGERT